jgi:hypothetical protein
MISRALREADKTAQRRAVDDRAASLLAHHAQLMLMQAQTPRWLTAVTRLEMLDWLSSV